MTATDAQPPVVLVVDDNPGFLRVMRAVLQRPAAPFEVHAAETGGEAIAFLLPEPPAVAPHPDLVVLDFRLPDTTAPELLEHLRGAGWDAAPVLVLSQAYWPEDEAAALGAGARRFLAKPSDPDTLRTLVVAFWHDTRPDAS